MENTPAERVLILGGGFAGLNTAAHLEKLLSKHQDIKITLVSRDNYSLFTPMLAEVAGGGIEPSHIVNPIRASLKRTEFREGVVRHIDLANKVVETEHPQSHAPSALPYDRLVIALGSVTNYRGLPGVKEHSFGLKTMADAQAIRDHVLSVLEQAALVEQPEQRACMLTFVIAGGGFSGAELCGALQDFIERALRLYPTIDPDEIRLVLAHPGPRILPEVSDKLGEYAGAALTRRGVEVRCNVKVPLRDGPLRNARRRRDDPDAHPGLDGRHVAQSGPQGDRLRHRRTRRRSRERLPGGPGVARRLRPRRLRQHPGSSDWQSVPADSSARDP